MRHNAGHSIEYFLVGNLASEFVLLFFMVENIQPIEFF